MEPDDRLRVRPATAGDVPALNELIPLSMRALSAGYYTPAQVESALAAHVIGVDTRLIADGTYFVAELDGRPVGCGGWSRRRKPFGGDGHADEGDDLLDPATDAARVRAFFVHPDFARRGIGRRLLAECERAARAAGFTRLELVATLPGVPLYAACGFAEVRPVELRFSDGTTAAGVSMAKGLR
jgi:GNAT superfamily N-acetyltransferase